MWKCLIICCISFFFADAENRIINFGGFACPREENALGECLRDALNAYIPQLATGSFSDPYAGRADYRQNGNCKENWSAHSSTTKDLNGLPQYGVPPCEPLHVPSIKVQQSSGPITVTSTYTDVTVSGPSRMRIKHLEVDSKQHRVVANLYIPKLRMKGNYDLSGQLLMLPIEGDGQFTSEYGDIDAVVNIKLGRAPRKNGVDALTCEDLDVKFHVEDASIHLDNLFGGEGDLGEAMNQFLNENWQQLSNELQTPMEDALRDFLKPLADHAFGTLNADDILSSRR